MREAVGLCAALLLFAACSDASGPVDLVGAVRASSDASLVIYDVAADTALVDVRADSLRPIVGLTALLTALASQDLAPGVLDAPVPSSRLRVRRLPGLEDERADTVAWTLDALLNAALRGDRAAGDEALTMVGRSATADLTAPGIEAPLPVGGLVLAWAPERRGDARTPSARADAFLALSAEARRDSAFARDRAFRKSASYRSAETLRLERRGLGLDAARRDALATATLPRGTAAAYARLAARPSLRARLLSLPAWPSQPPRTADTRLGALGSALSVSPDGQRVGVLLWQSDLGVPAAGALADLVAEQPAVAIR